MQPCLTDTLLTLEQQRCDAIVREDWARLDALLSQRLVHIHTRGNADDKPSYLDYMARVVRILDMRRDGMQVIALGEDAAVMIGRQINRAELRLQRSEPVQVESVVLQVWARERDGQWRQTAFQATPLGAPPPAVTR